MHRVPQHVRRARQYGHLVRRLQQASAAWKAGHVTYAEFGALTGSAWRAIEGAGPIVKGQVLAALRRNLPAARAAA